MLKQMELLSKKNFAYSFFTHQTKEQAIKEIYSRVFTFYKNLIATLQIKIHSYKFNIRILDEQYQCILDPDAETVENITVEYRVYIETSFDPAYVVKG